MSRQDIIDIRRIASPFMRELGIDESRVRFTANYDGPFGTCTMEIGSRGAKYVTINIGHHALKRHSTMLRTIAHEVYHAYQFFIDLPITEAGAKRYEKGALR